jgi:toxin ParE1/3/4
MRIVWSPLALARANDIADYIRLDKPQAAGKWWAQVFEKVENAALFPYSGRKVPEINRNEIREIIFGNYRIVYRIHDDELAVLTVRHGKRLLRRRDLEE